MTAPRPFLTAQWRHLLMLNYVVDPELLEPHVPAGTELDRWDGRVLVSLVGFQFQQARLLGWSIPGHRNFPEVNLRFYVRRLTDQGWRQGVVFLKELVPKIAVSWVARSVYHEQYLTLPMTHRVQLPGSPSDRTGRVEYRWRHVRCDFQMTGAFTGLPQRLKQGSLEEFIAEHYWAYTRWPDGGTREYAVEHAPWRVWALDRAEFRGEAASLYGADIAGVLQCPPHSALLAEGSPVTVFSGRKLESTATAGKLVNSSHSAE